VDEVVDSHPADRDPPAMTCTDIVHLLCMRKSRSLFGPRFSTGIYTGRNELPVENVCAQHLTSEVFPSADPVLRSLHRHAELTARRADGASTDQGNKPQPRSLAGYSSPVCSSTGDAIDRITAAIDQLASDARDAKSGVRQRELIARVADLWRMVSDLDPELARRAQRYTGPADGGPSD
jgi:hypothetical protein